MIKPSLFSRPLAGMVLLALSLLISACGGSSGGDSSSGGTVTSNVVTSDFAGSVGDGPIVGATVRIYDRNGTLLQTVASDGYAYYSTSVQAEENAYPLILEVNDGTDLVTGRAPDFKLSSVVLYPSVIHANINPYTTFMVEIARLMPGGITAENISAARIIVMDKLNFGLDPAFVDDPVGTQITDQNVAVMVKSSEVLGEMIRRTRDHLMAIGIVASGDDVVVAIAHDLVDGELDGRGGGQASNRVAAVSKLISAQVLIEALSNNLKVGDMVVTDRMDDAIITTRPSVSLSSMTDSVPVNQELLVQARDTIKVAQSLSPSAEVDAIAATLDSLRAGSMASDVEPVLPAGTSEALNQSISVAVAANDEQLDAAINGGSTDIPTDPATAPPVENTAPVLSGTPATSVLEDASYLYQPAASDADDDALSFSIQNRPGWALFDTSTGRLSGTPKNTHVGTYSNIVVTVSDGSLSDSVGPFSITVNNTNDAPSMSGSPVTSAAAGGLYSFQPSASDPDGDDLTFSIVKQPSWASFNISTGRLSGTPANGDAGTIYDGIVISVSDGSVSRSLPAFTITVSASLPSNRAPVISGTPATSVAEDSAYVFQPTASDADGDSLTFSISNLPSWASFNSTGLLSGTPKNGDAGSYKNILITVSDGAASASIGPFDITVSDTNYPPVISGMPATSVAEDSPYVAFMPTASDPDGDALSFSISNRPSWASFSASTGYLSGTPANGDAGLYRDIVISVKAGTDTASLPAFNITVSDTNYPPVISGMPATSVAEGSDYNFQPTASDPDSGDSLSFSINTQPAWASFDDKIGRLYGIPQYGDVGSSGIVISVTDGTETVSLPAFSIQVDPAPAPAPALGSFSVSWTAPVARADGTPISLADINGYRIYYGESSGSYPNIVDVADGTAVTRVVNDVPVGSYYVVMTTYDVDGRESAYSLEVSKAVQ